MFPSPWSTFDRQAPTGRLLICCSSLSKGGDHKKYWHQTQWYLEEQNICHADILYYIIFGKIISTLKQSALKIKHSFGTTKRWVWKSNSKSCVRSFCCTFCPRVVLINICDGCSSGCKRIIRAPHAPTIFAPGLIDSAPLAWAAKKPLFGIAALGFFRIFVISVKHILMYSILSWRWSG